MTISKIIDYKESLNPIKFQVIKKTLDILSNNNFIPHLEILLFTDFKGVIIPDYLKKLYPNQMLIVLQHQFHDLKVFEDQFSISLSFNRKQEQITIPFFAISKFHDKISEDILIFDKATIQNSQSKEHTSKPSGNIISIDQFRNR